jgi:hypothetical protein
VQDVVVEAGTLNQGEVLIMSPPHLVTFELVQILNILKVLVKCSEKCHTKGFYFRCQILTAHMLPVPLSFASSVDLVLLH